MGDLQELLEDDEYREALAENAYLRERAEQAAVASEHDQDDATYWTLAWDDLSDDAKRPYRTSIATAFDAVVAIGV